MTDDGAAVTAVPTPLGPVRLAFAVGARDAPPPARVERLPGGADVATWRLDDGTSVRLRWGAVTPSVPAHLVPTGGCWGAVWSIRAGGGVDRLRISALLTELPDGADGGPDSGEGLAAVTYTSDSVVLSVGTADEEDLHARAGHPPDGPRGASWLPPRWRDELKPLWAGAAHVRLDRTGVVTHLPSLAPGEAVHLHVAVARSDRRRDDGDVAPWFAVDTTPEHILAQLGAETGDRS